MISRRSMLAYLASLPALRSLAFGSAVQDDNPLAILGAGTAAVIRLDLNSLDIATLTKRLFDPPVEGGQTLLIRELAARVAALKKAGATELFFVLDFADFPGPPVLAVPVGPKADAPGIMATLIRGIPGLPFPPGKAEVVRGTVVVGSPAALARLREDGPANRPDLTTALSQGPPDAIIRIAVSPGLALRRAVEESLPDLPAELGGGPVTTITQGMSWFSVVLPGDLGKARATVQAKSPDQAAALVRLVRSGIESVARTFAAGAPDAKTLAGRLAEIRPEVREDQVVADIDAETIVKLVAIPLRQLREANDQSRSVNNLKSMGLAMHNYLSAHGTFPPAFRVDSTHRPLLSWRVLILPFIDEQKLFDEFHLDEPWESPHNKPLIARMPKVYAARSGGNAELVEGKTVYLTPRGGKTMFPGEIPVKLQDVTDGISNTIMVLEADDSQATIWTKPDDWDLATPGPDLAVRGLLAAMGDGSVLRLKPGISPERLMVLLTRDGNEAFEWDEFRSLPQ